MTSTRQRPMRPWPVRPGRALKLVSGLSLALAIMLSASCAAPREESTPSPSATEVAPPPTPEPEPEPTPAVPEAKPAPPAEALRGVEDAKGETEQETGVAPDEPAELDDGARLNNEQPAAKPTSIQPAAPGSPKLKGKDQKRCAPGESCEEEDPSLLRKMPGR